MFACTTCDRAVQDRLFDQHFVGRLAAISLPLLLGGIVAGFLVGVLVRRLERGVRPQDRAAAVAVAGTFLGLGLGGFVDGIVLHQLLQVHQMISNVVWPEASVVAKNINMFWDGIFHVGAWTLTVVGVVLLWRTAGRTDVRHSSRVLWASALLGWGAFNVLDSVFNHYGFRFHDVVERSAHPWAWNLAFLVFGVMQVVIGWLVVRRDVGRR